MNSYISVACKAIVLFVGMGMTVASSADALSDSVAAASKAADEAQVAAEQALQAAKASKAAADAAMKALAASADGGATASAAQPAAAAATTGPAPYAEHVKCEGKDCKIDIYLTKGFRAFSQCQVCHGLDGNGSTIGPSLVDKLKQIDKARFVEVVTDGLKGQIGVMPAWEKNPNVMKYIDNLYAYLKARSDGALPSGKLKRFDR